MDENFQDSVQSGPEPAGEQSGVISQDARNLAMLCHLLGLFTNFLGPLILWIIKKDDDSFIDEQGKEALNFQITVAIASVVSGILTMICIGAILAVVVLIADVVLSIMACVAASKGEHYRYPVSLRLVK